jgi:hypothetical protein
MFRSNKMKPMISKPVRRVALWLAISATSGFCF